MISALHKSMRGGDDSAALYWMARMMEGGEDPLFIARRLIEFASCDIGKNSAVLEMIHVKSVLFLVFNESECGP